MIKIAIIGYGNVAYHLVEAFKNHPMVELSWVYNRTLPQQHNIPDTCQITLQLSNIKEVDVAIIAVTDDAISEVSRQLNVPFVVHTSGAVPLSLLNNEGKKGVFYPLQSFSKSKPIDFDAVPICLEAQQEEDYQLLETLAQTISSKIYRIDSGQRTYLHVAAVFANNFTNHMYTLAHEICSTHQIPFEVLQPLIRETADKISLLAPKEAQTGPAKRNDKSTLAKHMALLSTEQQKLYSILTQSIQNYGD